MTSPQESARPAEPPKGFARGIDAALSVIDDRVRHWVSVRGQSGRLPGVIEGELRWVRQKIQARLGGEPQ